MAEITEQLGQMATILLIAIALGMDAFSLCIGIGMRGVRLIDAGKISIAIAVFHVIMPLIGFSLGSYFGSLLGGLAVMIGGGLLVALGGHMVYSALRGEEVKSIDHGSMLGISAFAFGVSVDSLSVGVSMGMFSTDLVLTACLFGLMGGLMSAFGLFVGRRVGMIVGEYGEALGGAVLLTFGILFLI